MKNLFRVISIFCLCLLTNCEKEKPFILSSEKVIQKAEFKVIDSKDFPTDKNFQSSLDKLKELRLKPFSSITKSSIFIDSITKLTIDLSQAKYYFDPERDYHSYTFTIIENDSEVGLRNIVLSLQPNGKYKKLLFTYDLSVEEIEMIKNKQPVSLQGKVKVENLDRKSFNLFQNKVQYYEDGCYYDEQYVQNTCASGLHVYGDSSCTYIGDGTGREALPGGETIISIISCDPTNGGGSNDGEGSGGDTTSPTLCPRCPSIDDQMQREEDLNHAITLDQFKLIEIDCDQISKWIQLAQFVPPQSVLDKIIQLDQANLFSNFQIQDINDAKGAIVNLDYFPVVIDRLPINPDTGARFTAEKFLQYIRKNINQFINTSLSNFTAMDEVNTGFNEGVIWNSNNPLGAIMHIEIPIDEGSVVCSDYSNEYWRFSTIETPWDSTHPVSGNREFGYFQNEDGSYTFYTRGVDRWESQVYYNIAAYFEGGNAFSPADQLWLSFQQGIQNFCNEPQNDGVANAALPVTNRPDWTAVKEYILGNRPISDLGCN